MSFRENHSFWTNNFLGGEVLLEKRSKGGPLKNDFQGKAAVTPTLLIYAELFMDRRKIKFHLSKRN